MMNDTVIENLSVSKEGAGFLIQNGKLIVNNCTASNMSALRGGFVSLLGDDTLQIENS